MKATKYIENLYADHGQARERFIEATALKDFIPVVDEPVARFLQVLIMAHRPQNILEIGTSIGFAAAMMADASKDYGGKITTIEFDEKVARQAQHNFSRIGLDDRINIIQEDALQVMPRLSGPYDMIFQDADKFLYPQLFRECFRLLPPGGLLVAEDVLFPVIDLDPKWHNLIQPIQEFNKLVVDCKELKSTVLPIGDGVLVAVKK